MAPACPSCGVALPEGAGPIYFVCAACRHEFMLLPPKRDPFADPTKPPPFWVRYGRALGGALAFLLLGSLIPYWSMSRQRKQARDDDKLIGIRDGVAPAGERMQWDPSGGPPWATDLDDDATEDFVGRIRLGGEAVVDIYLAGFRGSDLTRAWKGPSLGPSGQAGTMHTALVGDRLIATDAKPAVLVVDAATGQVQSTSKLPDAARALCVVPEGVWIDTASGGHLLTLTGDAVTLVKAERPASCPALSEACNKVLAVRVGWRRSSCEAPPTPPPANLFPLYTMRSGEHRVTVGPLTQGQPMPTLVGLDAQGAERWRQPVANVRAELCKGDPQDALELDHETLVAQYRAGPGNTRLTAFDAATGARLWDTEIPLTETGSKAAAVGIGPQRIYVPHVAWLDVFDRKTGAFVGTVGKH